MKNRLTPLEIRERKREIREKRRIIRHLEAIKNTRTFLDVDTGIENPPQKMHPAPYALMQKSPKLKRKIFKAEKAEYRFYSVLSCFDHESNQIMFQILCNSENPMAQNDLRREFKNAMGSEMHCPSSFTSSLERIVDHGFASFFMKDGNKIYSPTRKGYRYAAPVTLSLMDYAVKNKTSCVSFLGRGRYSEKSGSTNYRAKILLALYQNRDKTLRRTELVEMTGLDAQSLRTHLGELKKYRFIKYKGIGPKKYGYKTFSINEENIDKIKKDEDIFMHPLGYIAKEKTFRIMMKARRPKHFKQIAKEAGVNESVMSSFISLLEKKGYAFSRWKNYKKSEAIITKKGIRCAELLDEIKNSPSNLGEFREKYLSTFNRDNWRTAYELYFPFSKSYSEISRKKKILVRYLKEKGEAKAREIYSETPIKDRPILDYLVREKKICRRVEWRDVIYSLPRRKL